MKRKVKWNMQRNRIRNRNTKQNTYNETISFSRNKFSRTIPRRFYKEDTSVSARQQTRSSVIRRTCESWEINEEEEGPDESVLTRCKVLRSWRRRGSSFPRSRDHGNSPRTALTLSRRQRRYGEWDRIHFFARSLGNICRVRRVKPRRASPGLQRARRVCASCRPAVPLNHNRRRIRDVVGIKSRGFCIYPSSSYRTAATTKTTTMTVRRHGDHRARLRVCNPPRLIRTFLLDDHARDFGVRQFFTAHSFRPREYPRASICH